MRNNYHNSPLLIPCLFFMIIVCTNTILLVSSQCLNDQRSILVQLKNTLQYNSSISTKLASWSYDIDCCHWPGVDCDIDGHVTSLDLSSERIRGGLENSTLFGLSFLHTLNLAYNTFSYIEISPDFGNLTSLKSLNLSSSGFTGNIPIQLSRLILLESLDFSTLYFPGTPSLTLQNPDFYTVFRNLSMVTELYLDGVNISSRGGDWCEAVSSSFPNLKVLSLENCHLSGPISDSFKNLHDLSELYLGSNDLSVPIPEFFASFVNLRVLSLSSCNLSGTFPSEIFRLPNLHVLDLENNRLLAGSLPVFDQNGMIDELVLKGTNFSGRLPYSIGNLKNLSRLELSNCWFSGPLPDTIANLTELVRLDIQFNQFNGSIPSFQRSKNLTYIDLSHNTLTGSVPSTHFEGLTKLVFVDLAYNYLSGNIPATLFSLPSLQKALLSNNQFSGEIFEGPRNISFSPLDTLDLSSNDLQGNIPQFVFGLRKLNSLSLSFNNFSGHLSLDAVCDLQNLTSIDLSYNNLYIDLNDSSMSEFPKLSMLKLASCNLKYFPALMNQSKMITLDLSDNQITGKIPNWLWNGSLSYLNLSLNLLDQLERPIYFRSLSVIDLHFNFFKGEIPIPPTSAVYVDYSNNNFNFIPVDVGNNLTFTTYFSVSNNNLSGPIPQSICSGINLQVLDMSHNRFTNSIPRCLIENMTETLGVLNLGDNLLSGPIIDNFPKSCALKTLDFKGNILEGTVPMSLENCEFLEVLNLRKNQINDFFPCFLKTLSNLRVLVLRFNKFKGNIQCTNINNNITWPKLQIIDLARNNFSGELPEDSFLRWQAMMSHESGPNHISFEFLRLNHFYYQDTVIVTNKGLEMELVKILTVYTSIDFSSNRFEGHIPEAIGGLKSLYVLNLSYNSLTGNIPSSIGNLKQLGSLDLSCNSLSGEIPKGIAQLSFLAVLNLSYNHLVGRIPKGSQFNTFSDSSFNGNPDLCGLPLNETCVKSDSGSSVKSDPEMYSWKFICTGIGFGVGAGFVFAPFMFWERASDWCEEHIWNMVRLLFMFFGVIFRFYRNGKIDFESVAFEYSDDETVYSEEDEEKILLGRFCVYCSKLDIHHRKAIHNPKCTCYEASPIFSFSSTSTCS